MPDNTPLQGFRVPSGADDPDVVEDMTLLAEGIEKKVLMVFATASARNTAVTTPEEGMFAFTKDNNQLTYYDGTAWKEFVQGTFIIGSGGTVPTNADPGYADGDVFFKV